METEPLFFERLRCLDEILTRHSFGPSAIVEVSELLCDPDIRREFFDNRLKSADWVQPLTDAGYFRKPPKPELSEHAATRHPQWPESRYLARMAEKAPSEVASIFVGINTENAFIIGDMLDAALTMPAKVAATLVPAVRQATEIGSLRSHFKNAADLCARLADTGEVASAIELADALFGSTIEGDEKTSARRDMYWYNEGLSKVVPLLALHEPRRFLGSLCDWLKAHIDAKEHVGPESDSDHSYLWRPAIEEHGQNPDYDAAGKMVGFAREGFELAIRETEFSLEDAIGITDRYVHLVFKRIRVHLITEFAEDAPELARQTMMDRALFDNYEFKHEYALLLGRRLGLLTQEERASWFGWIDAGPDISEFEANEATESDSHAEQDNRENELRYWKYQRLYWVREHLEGDRKEFYQDMLAEHGEPKLADLNYSFDVGWGHESPMSVEDLAELSFEKAIDSVASWRPERQRLIEPDIRGLAATFEAYLKTDVEAFSKRALSMAGRPAIYVNSFIKQMCEAIKSGSEIDLPAVLELCKWVLQRPVEEPTTPDPTSSTPVDENWQWTRDRVGQFVECVCTASTESVPRYPLVPFRKSIWQLIEILCRDPVKSNILHDTSQDDPRLSDYVHLGINSSRGKAIEAALEYARWVANHLKDSDGAKETAQDGFDSMPEVRDMLEWQIAPENRSLVAMAVIGRSVHLIHWIDKNWLASNADQTFHLEGIEETPASVQGWSAWNAFLVWVAPHIEYYNAFKNQFAYAVEQAAQVGPSGDAREKPMHRLGEHLMMLYGRGQLDLDDNGGLLRRFLTTANPEVRRNCIGFVGRTLNTDKQVPPEVVGRFKTLWEEYWAGEGRADAEQESDEWLFGFWFSSGQFPADWALEHLEQFIEVATSFQPDVSVAKQLAKIAPTNIERAVRILDRMVRGDRDGWRIHSWRNEAKQILAQAMSEGGDAQVEAKSVINYLGRRGFVKFGNLLTAGRSTDAL